MTELSHKQLKNYQRAHRDTWNQGLSLRVHRARSWLDRAEQERAREDLDAEFLFLWISFNAAYASEYTHDQRLQQRDACGILAVLLPITLQLMMQHGNKVWADAAYFITD